MDYSTWLSSSSLDVSLDCGGGGGGGSGGDNTLRLLDDSPVRDCVNKVHVATNSSEVGSNPLLKHEVGTLIEELNRVNGENKKLTETLTSVREEYNDLKRKLMNYVGKSYSDEVVDNATTNNKRRKMENYYVANHCNNDDINNNNDTKIVKNNSGESSSSDEEDSCQKPLKSETLKAKITRVAVRTQASDSTLILKDGYLWRKYGQKVTRDNPCPRAYFKCSFAPSCPVKKKVQRSQEDQSMLVATYEGEHNHAPPPNQETSPNSGRGVTLSSIAYNNDDNNNNTTLGSSCPNRSLDQTKSMTSQNVPYDTTKSSSSNVSTITTLPSNNVTKFNSPEFQKLLAEQMASSLTKDPNFTAALAAAISGRISRQ